MDKLDLLLRKQGYSLVGSHSAVKVCTWTKKSLKNLDFCYKQKFYGINSHLCCQISTSVGYCQNKCLYCWREIDFTVGKIIRKPDSPKDIIDQSILGQRKLLSGFGGDMDVDKKKLKEAQEPMHFAISLTGEPLIYPKLSDLITELHKKGKTTFVVTNGLLPDKLAKLVPPTQLYISIEAPNKKLHTSIARSSYRDAWQRQQKSLFLLCQFPRTVLRITAIKGLNMVDIQGYADIIRKASPDFVEVKAYMFVGSSRQRLSMENMPLHPEIRAFASAIALASGYSVKDEKKESRVVLLARPSNARFVSKVSQ